LHRASIFSRESPQVVIPRRIDVEANHVPVQKVMNPLETIRDRESWPAGRRFELVARREEFTSSGSQKWSSALSQSAKIEHLIEFIESCQA
jgi:hypothetical protein